jgi:RNA polymerase sigma factor (sigma-70 family)
MESTGGIAVTANHGSALRLGEHKRDLSVEVTQHERLVHWVVHRQWLGGLPYTEAVQEGRIGLWRALERFDPARGCTVSTYAVPAIERAVWRAVARAQRGRARPAEAGPADPPRDPDACIDAEQVADVLHAMVVRLPDVLAFVVIAHWGLDGREPWTFATIGQALGVTKQRAHQLHTEALIQLADPTHSLALRRLVDRNTVADYQAFLRRRRAWQRARRGGAR